jgi:hypothetical protein
MVKIPRAGKRGRAERGRTEGLSDEVAPAWPACPAALQGRAQPALPRCGAVPAVADRAKLL